MQIRELEIPAKLEEIFESGLLRRNVGSWALKSDFDSYGNPLETELGELYDAEARIAEETRRLATDFVADGFYGEASQEKYPGGIPDIVDFEKILCFGCAGDGSPFCLDYRESSSSPSVIWWDDVYWRKVSPTFEMFLELLDINPQT